MISGGLTGEYPFSPLIRNRDGFPALDGVTMSHFDLPDSILPGKKDYVFCV